jgi:hypothetical protein
MTTIVRIILILLILAWAPRSIECGLGYWHDVPRPDEQAVMGLLIRPTLNSEWERRVKQ